MGPQGASHRVVAVVRQLMGPFVPLVNPPTHGKIWSIAVACDFVSGPFVPLVLIPDAYDFVVEAEVVDRPHEVFRGFRRCGKWLHGSKNRCNEKRRRGEAHGGWYGQGRERG